MNRTLVLGGARSGKSAHAEGLLGSGAVRYVATARRWPGDDDWDARIAAHRARRPPSWTTIEDTDPVNVLREPGPPLLVDDMATWLTGVLDDATAWEAPSPPPVVGERTAALVAAVAACPSPLVLVSAEVGLGVVPATRAGRLFRDELGALNAALAEACDEVLLLVAGLPLRLK
ncbi:bifunctional adenosylcobinamide kinase/adenosylcobinamide-phosphate guanylyltransferase [Pseudonocardia sp.]|uniref:bifunctional adenosylcobinamide kinase/adenosylcobinamide-phosphate guanylyltransferase n=1 Tax=Pseudonocardia sp. TaxID=60912 RepID=UPI003D0FF7A0